MNMNAHALRQSRLSIMQKEEPFAEEEVLLNEGEAGANSLRFAEVLDHSADKRRERIVSLFGPVEFREISSASSHGLMQFDGVFDVLICSVDDVARLRSAVRPPADKVIKLKTSFAYSEKTSPGRRAQLLKLGFDDVFHSSMTNEEIRLRFESIIYRNKIYRNNDQKEKTDAWNKFSDKYICSQIRGKQKDIIIKLFEANGATVGSRDLATYDFALDAYNTSSLKATISNLRKKLVGCDILSVHGEGYRLSFQESSLASKSKT